MFDTDWKSLDCVALDFETTHLNPNWGRVCEIGAVHFRGEFVDCRNAYVTRINPKKSIGIDERAVHGIDGPLARTGPEFHEQKDTFRSFLGERIIVTHRAATERRLLRKHLESYDPLILDLGVWAQHLHPSAFGLPNLVEHYEIAHLIPQHPNGRELKSNRAYFDASATAFLFVAFVREHFSGQATLRELIDACKTFETSKLAY